MISASSDGGEPQADWSDGDYTPFGYLRNPGHRAMSWQEVSGGNLRTADDSLGLEWVYPWHKHPLAGAGISLTTRVGGRACRRRADFAALAYTARHHSADVLGFDWSADEVSVAARFFLVNDHTLGVCLRVRCHAAEPRQAHLGVFGRAWAAGGATGEVAGDPGENAVGFHAHGPFLVFDVPGSDPRLHALALDTPAAASPSQTLDGETWAGWEIDLALGPGEQRSLVAALGRADNRTRAAALAAAALPRAPTLLDQRLQADAAFRATCPTLDGDWPPDWRSGLVYDLETTRGLVLPPGGLFRDVWPTWMAAWPRVVLAEGTLDMLRLALADPETAKRAVLALLRDAPEPNVPCVFQDGGYNMLAADGQRCGTSPAWCLPFLNLELLYLRTLDRAWLAAVYPYLAAYLDWWLDHRTDARGWVVYACTWESGEDGNPRLDPTGSGDRVISQRVRPVELQASVAHAATVLAFFARQLGRPDDARRWQRVRAAYRRRTQALFDPDAGRFRDWLVGAHKKRKHFVPPCPDQPYWGVDACRWSPLSLTPLLAGLVTPDQARALRAEFSGLATAPWTSWPSWCYVLVECAAAAGLYALAGEIAGEVIDRVYRVTTRRSLAELSRPTPGAAPEFWPQDWRTFQGCDAYGWGATTANLLVRHLVGFKEARATLGWQAQLTPALPPGLRVVGRRYALRRLQYRGVLLDLTYTVEAADRLTVELDLPRSMGCAVRQVGPPPRAVYASRAAARTHRFSARLAQAYHLALREPG